MRWGGVEQADVSLKKEKEQSTMFVEAKNEWIRIN
jgi:hypothetical protein